MRIRNKTINDAKPVIFYATKPVLVFDFDVDLPSGTYTLAIDVDRTQDTVKMAAATATPSGRQLTFTLDTYNTRFQAACAAGNASIEVWRGDEVYLQDTIPVAPRVDVDGIPPAPLELYPKTTKVAQMISESETAFLAKSSMFTGHITIERESTATLTVKCTAANGFSAIEYVGTARSFSCGVGNASATIESLRNCWYVYDQTAAAPRLTISPAGLLWASDISINGTASLAAKLAQIDADLAAGGEGSSFYPPVANYLVNDATYGAVYYLDSTIPSIVFAERVLNLKKVRLRLVSANPAVTGNIVIVPAVDGVDQTPVTLEVGATAETCEIEFTVAVTGRFALRRDYAAAADTLDDVTAIVTALRILEV